MTTTGFREFFRAQDRRTNSQVLFLYFHSTDSSNPKNSSEFNVPVILPSQGSAILLAIQHSHPALLLAP
jgi:hypothetical protein